MKKRSILLQSTSLLLITALSLGSWFIRLDEAEARTVRNTTRTSVHHQRRPARPPHGNVNINKNVNVNKNVTVRHGGGRYHAPPPRRHYHYHDNVGRAFAAGAITGLAVGAIVTAASMPPSCTTTIVNNISYRQCGNTWYQPYYAGTQVQYVVINPPY